MIITLLFDESISTSDTPTNIDVNCNDSLLSLKTVISLECNIPIESIELIYNGSCMADDNMKLSEYGVVDNEIIYILKRQQALSTRMTLNDIPHDISPEALLQLMKSQSHILEDLKLSEPNLAEAIVNEDVLQIRKLLMIKYLAHHKIEYEKQIELRNIESNPDSEESQRILAERIRLENIQQSLELAVENMPESFVQVNMLYINVFMNGIPIKAFVDSGAQSTIITLDCVKRCNLERLVDTRYSGEARGVGTGKIIGRIHIAQLQIGQSFFPVSLTVLEKSDVEFLFGLDMLKRHRCCLDLGSNSLRIEGHGGVESIPFVE